MSVVTVTARQRPDGDVGFDVRRALGFNDSLIPPCERPGPVSIDIPECGPDESRRIVSTWLDLHLPGWSQRLAVAVL
jgi:hypothetical protein